MSFTQGQAEASEACGKKMESGAAAGRESPKNGSAHTSKHTWGSQYRSLDTYSVFGRFGSFELESQVYTYV